MPHLILVRHGQSEWNLEKRFTGWVDVKLSSIGKLEACKAGESIKEQNINIDYFYSSFQLRAINTLKLIKDTLRNKNEIIKAWELNERHYGALTGLNKDEIKKKIGEKKILELRRSWNIRPEPLNRNSPYHPLNIETYKSIPKKNVPDTESLEDTFNRVVSYYKHEIENKLAKQKNILISAHGNSIRALCKYLFKLDNKQIINLEIPTGNPLVIQLDQKYEIKNCKYLIKEKARDLIIF
tara:strand:- start:2497 stop:3213 length:717 start_codon:yes stop_codon:yes gene_type:complete